MYREISFPSVNGRDTVQGIIYAPACESPKAVVQVIHGFGEHHRRYFHIINALNDAGFVVAADDHVGHGKTAQANDTWGNWGEAGPHTMMEDEHTLTKLVKELYPDLPYFLCGHSMGSLITRDYIATYGDELAGATMIGTCGIHEGYPDAIALGQKLCDEGKGDETDDELVNMLFPNFDILIDEEIIYGNEWICHDRGVQKDYSNDPLAAFVHPTANRAMKDFCTMAVQVQGTEWAEKVPTDLPLYNVAGDEDPFGTFGVGPYLVANWLIQTGHKVKTVMYTGKRHEILNYVDIKDDVEQGIIDFMDGVLAK